jgi:hypothetical protein
MPSILDLGFGAFDAPRVVDRVLGGSGMIGKVKTYQARLFRVIGENEVLRISPWAMPRP